MVRKVVLYKENFSAFYKAQDKKVQEKIEYVLDLVRFEKQVLTTFKKIRILCFLDQGELVVLTNCFLKKTQRTPLKEIEKAERLKKEYLIEKYGGK
jgi:phage-related protein